MTLKNLMLKVGLPTNKNITIKQGSFTIANCDYGNLQFRQVLPYMGYKVQYIFFNDNGVVIEIANGCKLIKKIKRFFKKLLTK